MRLIFLTMFLVALLFLSSSVFAIQEPPGEYIGDLIQTQQFSNEPIQIVSTPQNTYYLVTNQQSYYSSNGKTWVVRNTSLPTAGGLAIDSSGILYISGSDVYKSVDGGVKWNIVGPGEFGSTSNLKVKIVQGTLYAWHPDKGLYYYNPSLGHWYVSINSTIHFKVYDFIYVDGGMYYLGVQNGEVKLFHGLEPKGTITGATTDSLYPTLYRKLLTYYEGAIYAALRKTTGGGAIYKSSDLGQTWEKVHDTSSAPASISSSTVNGIQVLTSGKVWRSWSGSVWKEVKSFTGGGGIDIVSTNVDRQTIVAAGYAMYTYDRNAFPILTLTESYSVQKNQDLQLSLSAQDLEGDTLTYKWEKIGGPDTYTLTGETTQTATFRATQDGIYNINVSATDSSSGKSTKTVIITVGTGVSPPVAKVGLSPSCHAGFDCYLPGWHTGTGTNITYQWTQNSGPSITWITNYSTTGSGSFIPSGLGTYNFTLKVRSNEGESIADLSLTVTNIAPIINLTATKTCVVQFPCKITAIVLNSDHDSQTFLWYTQPAHVDPKDSESNIEFIRGKEEEEVTISVRTKGSYTLYFSAFDSKVTSVKRVDIKSITETEYNKLQANNTSPVANAGQDQNIRVNQPVNLDGSKSFDPENYTLSFLWEKLSGPDITINNATEAVTTFTPTQIGTYIIRLTVADVLGLVSNDTIQITVVSESDSLPTSTVQQSPQATSIQQTTPTQTGNKPPVIQIKETVEGKSGEEIIVDSLAVDPESGELTYLWSQIGGEEVIIENKNSSALRFTAAKPGLYTFEVTVTDNQGKTATKRVNVKLGDSTKPLQGEQNILLWVIVGVVVIVIVVGLVFWKAKFKKK